MKSRLLIIVLGFVCLLQGTLSAHCQMPCGVYHDEMVFSEIDQYIETMFKGMTVINANEFKTVQDHNEFVRWVIEKDRESNRIAEVISIYFLQQKIKPGEEDTTKRLVSAHNLLFLLVKIKQTADRNIVDQFADEWEKFKLMFHVEGYACKIEMLKQRNREKADQQGQAAPVPDHEHDHDHPHTH